MGDDRGRPHRIELGESLRVFLRDVLELRSTGGGVRGSGTRVTEQMKRLFGSLLTAQCTGSRPLRSRRRAFSDALKNSRRRRAGSPDWSTLMPDHSAADGHWCVR